MKVDFYICPECGDEVRVGSKGCPRCASQQATKKWNSPAAEPPHWEQDETHDGLDLPDEEFDYQKFVQEEFGGPRKVTLKERMWWVVAVLLLLAMLFFALSGLLRL